MDPCILYAIVCWIQFHAPCSNYAQIESTDLIGKTPLHYAADSYDHSIIKYLLEKGANIEAKDNNGWTPLHYSAFQDAYDYVERDESVSQCLIDNGAQIEAADINGETPLHKAASGCSYLNLEVVECLLYNGAQIGAKTKDGLTPLHFAAFLDKSTSTTDYNLEVIKCLLDNGAQIEAKTKDGFTPLHFAADGSNLEIVKYLVEHGAKIDARNNENETPFLLSNKKRHDDVSKYLLEKKRDMARKYPPEYLNVDAFCIICLAPRNGLFVLNPCGHTSFCEPCCFEITTKKFAKCPSCRKAVRDYTKIFFQEPEH